MAIIQKKSRFGVCPILLALAGTCVGAVSSLNKITTSTADKNDPVSLLNIHGLLGNPATTFTLQLESTGTIQRPLGGGLLSNDDKSIIIANTRDATKSYFVTVVHTDGSHMELYSNFAEKVAELYARHNLPMPPSFQGLFCTGLEGQTADFMLRWYDMKMRQDSFSLGYEPVHGWSFVAGSFASENIK